jgi:hypothetical protein
MLEMKKQTVWLWRSAFGILPLSLSSTLSASTGATVRIQTSRHTCLSNRFLSRRCPSRDSAQRYVSCWRSFAAQSKPGALEARANSSQQATRGRSLARGFRGSSGATRCVAPLACEGRERLSERTLDGSFAGPKSTARRTVDAEVASVYGRHGRDRSRRRGAVSQNTSSHATAAEGVAFMGRCRTESMGLLGRVACEECGDEYPLFRSCRNRNCPGCQAEARAAWLDAREQELLDVPYFHVVFTVPEELNVIALWCPEVFYAALLRAAGKALLDVGFTKLQARLAVLAILHTWGQNLWLHPHAHCVVPGGGFSADGKRWISVPNPEYLLPVKVLWRHFRTLLCRRLRAAARRGQLRRLPAEVSAEPVIAAAAAKPWWSTRRLRSAGRSRCSSTCRSTRIEWRSATAGSWGTRTVRSLSAGVITPMAIESKNVRSRHRSSCGAFCCTCCRRSSCAFATSAFFANGHRAENIQQARALIGRLEVLRFRRERVKPQRLCPSCRAAAVNRAGQAVVPASALRSPPEVHAA